MNWMSLWFGREKDNDFWEGVLIEYWEYEEVIFGFWSLRLYYRIFENKCEIDIEFKF